MGPMKSVKLIAAALLLGVCSWGQAQSVVISEILYDLADEANKIEFIELHNAGGGSVNISNWRLSEGVFFTFPSSTTIPAGGYLVVALDPSAMSSQFGVGSVGPFSGKLASSDVLHLYNPNGVLMDQVDYKRGFPWPNPDDNQSIELTNMGVDNDLGGNWRVAANPTPGAANGSLLANPPPAVRQVEHAPVQPTSADAVTITAKATDLNGVGGMTLQYQVVAPGSYIQLSDAAYTSGWVNVTMRDDGTSGDVLANDSVFTAVIPSTVQQHRRLIRYRIQATDGASQSGQSPPTSDPSPNFAYFVYNGTPNFNNPNALNVSSSGVNYNFSNGVQVPTYHLITSQALIDANLVNVGESSMEDGTSTLVHDGKVYDHIQYHVKGDSTSSRTRFKRNFKLKLNRGHRIRPVDNYGQRYKAERKRLIFSGTWHDQSANQQYHGMVEGLSYEIFNLLGADARYNDFAQLRVISGATEMPASPPNPSGLAANSMYNNNWGDFWGIFMVQEHIDGAFVDEHGLEDGPVFKYKPSEVEHQAAVPPYSMSDSLYNTWDDFAGVCRCGSSCSTVTNATAAQWRAALNFEKHKSFMAANNVIANADTLYRTQHWYVEHYDPVTQKWQCFPGDFDRTWYNSSTVPYCDRYGDPFNLPLRSIPELEIEIDNRLRSTLDILYNSDQGDQLIDDTARWIYDPALTYSLVHADSGRWGHTADFASQLGTLKSFLNSRANFLETSSNELGNSPNLPGTPTISYQGPGGYPADGLSFQASSFVANGNGSAASIEFRIGRVTNTGVSDPLAPRYYEAQAVWESGELSPGNTSITIPVQYIAPGAQYRVRVRYENVGGHKSRWSAPIEFQAGQAQNVNFANLIVSEVHYNPLESGETSFLEFHNKGGSSIPMYGVTISGAVDYTFPIGTLLAPGDFLIVVEDRSSFDTRYRDSGSPYYYAGIDVAGKWSGGLSSGEHLIVNAPSGSQIMDFEFSGAGFWPERADGLGSSAELISPGSVPTGLAAKNDYLDLGANWKASCEYHGNPGRFGNCTTTVAINEVMTGSSGWVELYNYGSSSATLSSRRLSDTFTNPNRYTIPNPTSIPAGGYMVFPVSTTSLNHPVDGGEVLLTRRASGVAMEFIDSEDWGPGVAGVTFGRYVRSDGEEEFTAMTAPTQGAQNSQPLISPVVISEVMYNPQGTKPEYIEIVNRSTSAVELFDPANPGNTWKLTSAVDFTFPLSVTLDPCESVLVTTASVSTLRAAYAIPASTRIFSSPLMGALNNAGEKLKLRKPGIPSFPGLPPLYILVDKVDYLPVAPWPTTVNGTDRSIERDALDAYGNDPDNWSASALGGSPGTTACNEAPDIDPIANKTAPEQQQLAFTATATDPQGDNITFTLASGPAGASITSGGAFTWTPTEAQGPGSYNVEIRATDDGSPAAESTESFTVTVTEQNRAPSLTIPASLSGDEGSAITFTASASDPDLPANTLTFSLISAPSGASINSSSGAFTWTPSESQGPDSHNFQVRVSDGSLTDTKSITITVNEVNANPAIPNIPNQTIPEMAAYSYDANVNDPDVPANSHTFSLTTAPAGMSINSGSGLITWTPTESQGPDSYGVTVRVVDNGSPALADTESFTLTVTEVNRAPTIPVIADQNVAHDEVLNLQITASDPDIPANSLTFSLVSGVGSITSGGQYSYSPTINNAGNTYPVTVRVTDNGSPAMSFDRTFNVVVTFGNRPPDIDPIATQTVQEATAFSYTATATDPDDPPNNFSFALGAGAPSGMSITAAGAISWTPTEAQGPGTYEITVEATDDGDPPLTGSETFTIIVTEHNRAPTLTAPSSLSGNELSAITFTASATDPDLPANTLTYSLIGAPGGASINSGTGAFSWTPTEAQGPGSHNFQVRVSDGDLTDTKSVTITVNEVNSSPSIPNIQNQTIPEMVAYSYDVNVNDSDQPANTHTFSLSSAPAGMTIDGASGLINWTPEESHGPGSHNVTVQVVDNGSPALADTESFTLTATEVNRAPTIPVMPDQYVAHDDVLTIQINGSDPDLPANSLTYTLVSGVGSVTSGGQYSYSPTINDAGNTYPVTVRVTDNGSPVRSFDRTFNVVVTYGNRPPDIDPIATQTVQEATAFSYTATATDPDDPPNNFSFALGAGAPSGMSITAAGAISWTPTEAQGPGTYEITVEATDDGDPPLTGSETFTIIVTEHNRAPTLTAPANLSGNELSAITFTASATDPDIPANTLTFSLVGAPPGATINSGTGAFSWTPTEAQGPEVYNFQVRVSDGDLTDTKSVTITVNEVNASPTIATIPDQTIPEMAAYSYDANVSDPDLPANSHTFSLSSAPAGMTIDGASGLINWTPDESHGPGSYNVIVQVADNGSPALADTESFTLTVTEVNRAPTIPVMSDQYVSHDEVLTIQITGSDPDLPANGLTYTLVSGVGSITTSGQYSFSPTIEDGGNTYPVTVRVTDNGSPAMSFDRTFNVVVTFGNRPPDIDPIPTQTVQEASTFSYSATATDPDDPPNNFVFSLGAGAPSGMTITSTGAISWTPTEAQGPGTYQITVEATDDGDPPLTGSETFTIIVTEQNLPPVLSLPGSQSGNELSAITFTASATDPDLPANTLSYSLVGAPGGASIDSATGAFSWTPTEAQGPGSYNFQVRVSDGALTDTKSISVTVNEVNSAPSLSNIQNVRMDELTLMTRQASASDSDIPANTMTFSLTEAPAGMTIDPATGEVAWTPTEAQGPGNYSVTVQVSDNGNPPMFATEVFSVKVDDVNEAPFIEVIALLQVAYDDVLNFQIPGSDPDIPVNSLTYSLVSGPGSVSASGTYTYSPTLADAGNTYAVTVRVSDDGKPAQTFDRTFNVEVTFGNRAPIFDPIPAQSVDEMTAYSYTVTATDPDDPPDNFTFSLASAPAGMTITPAGVISWTPGESVGPGTVNVQVQATDDGDPAMTSSAFFDIQVNEVNRSPTVQSIAAKTVAEHALLSFAVTATDPDLPANNLTYSLVSGPGSITAGGQYTYTPGEADGGNVYTVTVRVTDDGSPVLTHDRSFTITVTEDNSAPQLAGIQTQTADEMALFSYDVAATDSDLPAQSLTYSLDGTPPSGMSITADGHLTWTPGESVGPGSVSVTVRVTDNGNPAQSDTATFGIDVQEVNRAPSIAAVPQQTATEKQTFTLGLTGSDPDLPANSFTFTHVSGPGTVTPTGLISWTPDESHGGNVYSITVRITDNGSPPLSSDRVVSINVIEDNEVPTLSPIANQNVDEGQLMSVQPVVSDPDTPAQTFTWTLVSGPAGVQIDVDTGLITWTPDFTQGGQSYNITLRATDDGTPAYSDDAMFSVTVNDVNSPPTLTPPASQSITERSPWHLQLQASDPDAQPLTYSLGPGSPAGMRIEPDLGIVSWLPAEDQGGTSGAFEVLVSDGTASDSETLVYNVQELNGVPTVRLAACVVTNDLIVSGDSWSYLDDGSDQGTGWREPWYNDAGWAVGNAQFGYGDGDEVTVVDYGGDIENRYMTTYFRKTFTVADVHAIDAIEFELLRDDGAVVYLNGIEVVRDNMPAGQIDYQTGASVSVFGAGEREFHLYSIPLSALAQGQNTIAVEVHQLTPNSNDLSFDAKLRLVDNGACPVPTQAATSGQPVQWTVGAEDPDSPVQGITFSLGTAPTGASIDPNTGLLSWTPQVGGEFTIQVKATDTQGGIGTLLIPVSVDGQALALDEGAFREGDFQFPTTPGETYIIEYCDDLNDPNGWTHLQTLVATDTTTTIAVPDTPNPRRMYRVGWQQ